MESRDKDERKYDRIEEIGLIANTMNQPDGRIVRYLYELGRGKAAIEAGQGMGAMLCT
jgi:hypothetical protein